MTASSASIEEEISFPPKLRPKPQERWIGPGKAYADHAAFDADLAAYKEEKAERAIQVKKRERALDRRRDRSNRQRDQEHESDAQRRVRQRKESEAQSAAHIKREAERTAQKRRAPLLVQQEAWAADVAVFAAVFDADEPRKHPLAYSSHRSGDWLSDGRQIQALHNIIAREPPDGTECWEATVVDQMAFILWRERDHVGRPIHKLPYRDPEDTSDDWWDRPWSLRTHKGDGYWMLLSLPSVPKHLAAHRMLKHVNKGTPTNGQRASEGLGPVPGWETSVALGYMTPPPHQDLPRNYMELIDQGGEQAERHRQRFCSSQRFCDGSAVNGMPKPGCKQWHHFDVPCGQAHRFPLHPNAATYLPRMAGIVHIAGRAEPAQGHMPVDEFIDRIRRRDRVGRQLHPHEISMDCSKAKGRIGYTSGYNITSSASGRSFWSPTATLWLSGRAPACDMHWCSPTCACPNPISLEVMTGAELPFFAKSQQEEITCGECTES